MSRIRLNKQMSNLIFTNLSLSSVLGCHLFFGFPSNRFFVEFPSLSEEAFTDFPTVGICRTSGSPFNSSTTTEAILSGASPVCYTSEWNIRQFSEIYSIGTNFQPPSIRRWHTSPWISGSTANNSNSFDSLLMRKFKLYPCIAFNQIRRQKVSAG